MNDLPRENFSIPLGLQSRLLNRDLDTMLEQVARTHQHEGLGSRYDFQTSKSVGDPEVSPHAVKTLLLDYITDRVAERFDALLEEWENTTDSPKSEDDKKKKAMLFEIATGVLQQLDMRQGERLKYPLTELRSVADRWSPVSSEHRTWPLLPLNDEALLTNDTSEASFHAHLGSELESADRVDLVGAFIRKSGLMILDEKLRALRQRGVPIRVITTTYMGATQAHAVDHLVQEYGAQVKITYETAATRLHAKAWLLHRNTGFSTAFIGSSNISQYALVDGKEWNVRLSQRRSHDLIESFRTTFDGYWLDPVFEAYDPDRDHEKLRLHLAEATDHGKQWVPPSSAKQQELEKQEASIQPRPYQAQVLKALEVAREQADKHANLVVAATGTGKTVMAALDYRRLREKFDGRLPRLLFVAHRREILEQALATYRRVLLDPEFGELFFAGHVPKVWDHVFATVQSLRQGFGRMVGTDGGTFVALNREGMRLLSPDHFEIVVVDEFHHAEAQTYRLLLDFLKPQELLGITATPERSDGENVARRYFDNEYAFEIRLWDAIDQGMLVPFQYFGIGDLTDFRALRLVGGHYIESDLDEIYQDTDQARFVVDEVRRIVDNPHEMKALGFCASVKHAQLMAKIFCEAGLPAVALHAHTPADKRSAAVGRLSRGELRCIFTVDLFNEGVDIPEADTILMIRPTRSTVLFLQQLGRGLRLSPGKALLTVLDFIGHHHRDFVFEEKYAALLGQGPTGFRKQLEKGTFILPPGCSFQLDRVSRERVLENIKAVLNVRAFTRMAKELGTTDLAEFLEISGYTLTDVYGAHSRSWTGILRQAGMIEKRRISFDGIPVSKIGDAEDQLLKRIREFTYVRDRVRREGFSSLLFGNDSYGEMNPQRQALTRMLIAKLFTLGGSSYKTKLGINQPFSSYDEALTHIRRFPDVCAEIRQVMDVAGKELHSAEIPVRHATDEHVFTAHATYSRPEILAVFGFNGSEQKPVNLVHQAGVEKFDAHDIDLMFVTLQKDPATRSPETLYKDYAISSDRFHWESPASWDLENKNTLRYTDPQRKRWLFVREKEQSDFHGKGAPFTLVGPATYVNATGGRPVQFEWELPIPMPNDLYQQATTHALALPRHG